MPFKIDPVALVLDVFTFGCWSAYWNIQRIIEPDNKSIEIYMNIPTDKTLYEKVKKQADMVYDKPSAYKSGYIVKTYKSLGGKYSGTKQNTGLVNWFRESWKDIGNKTYPVYRPTKRVNKNTPLLASEINPTNLKQQIALKQKIRGTKNLPAFISK